MTHDGYDHLRDSADTVLARDLVECSHVDHPCLTTQAHENRIERENVAATVLARDLERRRALFDLDALGIAFGPAMPGAKVSERRFGIPMTGRAGSRARWADAERHSDARRGSLPLRPAHGVRRHIVQGVTR